MYLTPKQRRRASRRWQRARSNGITCVNVTSHLGNPERVCHKKLKWAPKGRFVPGQASKPTVPPSRVLGGVIAAQQRSGDE